MIMPNVILYFPDFFSYVSKICENGNFLNPEIKWIKYNIYLNNLKHFFNNQTESQNHYFLRKYQ